MTTHAPVNPEWGATMTVPKRAGFTLIELLVVMTVVAILAAIAIPTLRRANGRAFRAVLQADLKGLSTLQDVYHSRHYTYTTDLTALGFDGSEGVTVALNAAARAGWGATATHAGVPLVQCGIFYGDAAPSTGDPATAAGVMACDY